MMENRRKSQQGEKGEKVPSRPIKSSQNGVKRGFPKSPFDITLGRETIVKKNISLKNSSPQVANHRKDLSDGKHFYRRKI